MQSGVRVYLIKEAWVTGRNKERKMTSRTIVTICTVLLITVIGGVVMATNCELMPMSMGGWAF